MGPAGSTPPPANRPGHSRIIRLSHRVNLGERDLVLGHGAVSPLDLPPAAVDVLEEAGKTKG
eukprot:7581030-Pyramimonas_sp.AAC.1